MTLLKTSLELALRVSSIIDRNNERKYKEQILELKRKIEAEELKNEPDDLIIHLARADLECILSIFSDELDRRAGDTGKS